MNTTYRGRSLDEIVPRIRAELGPDAVIVRQREGLTGGIGGFFQKQCVEVEARRPAPRVDLYDDGSSPEPEGFAPLDVPELRNDAATKDGLSSPAVKKLIAQARPFAEQLEAAAGRTPLAAPRHGRPAEADEVERELVAAGLRPELAAGAVSETVSHLLPFGGELRELVRGTLARRIRVLPGWAGQGRALAFVGAGGSGKTSCVAELAAAYALGGDLPVLCLTLMPRDGGAELRRLLGRTGVEVWAVESGAEARARVETVRGRAVVVVDTPGLSTGDDAEIAALAGELEQVGLYEVHLALPATLSAPAAREQARVFAALGVSRIALTHAGETEHVGPVVDLAMADSRPLSFVASAADDLVPADAHALARRLLP